MRNCSNWLAGAINPAWVNGATLVPIPPSKARSDPEFDDRMTQICRSMPVQFPLDVRELVTQRVSIQAAHEGDDRPTVEGLLNIYEINEAACAPTPQRIAIVDDVLTVGVHYRAMHIRLSQRFPGLMIVGMFIARRVFPDDVAPDQLNLL
jgi:predicted amidophosphoribosyltransferase